MHQLATLADKVMLEAEMPVERRWTARTVYALLCSTASAHPARPAVSFQITSGPRDRAVTLTWGDLRTRVTQAANLFRRLGVTPDAPVAYLLPNCPEAAVALLAGATAGVVCPISPLLEPAQIAGILRETGAKVLVTLAPFPRSDVAERAARAVAEAPGVTTILQVDLAPYLDAPKRWIIPFVRPKATGGHPARVLGFGASVAAEAGDRLSFEEAPGDPIAAYFHTGGTTGLPKIAQHRQSGMIYNGWCARELLFTHEDVLLCPLPLFHVFAAYPILMSCVSSGAHMVMPTPQGYRGAGVMENFWKLIARWRVTFLITVPTAVSALMQRPVDADVSSLRFAICGSAPLPLELFSRFEAACGVKILEGYGMTEATCLVACNPPLGARKVGSVGLPMPYTEVAILLSDADGGIERRCGVDEIGEICVKSPGVFPGYREAQRNAGVFTPEGHLRTGDLGRIDADGYLWITGRAKDLIIRGGHNIDPAMIEEALASHPAVAMAGAIGQPDAHAGEVPAAYVELVAGAAVTPEDLVAHASARIPERAAIPKHVEILASLPKTAVGKIFKPALRRLAIIRVYDAALAEAGIRARVAEVREDKTRGLIARIAADGPIDKGAVTAVLGRFPVGFDLG